MPKKKSKFPQSDRSNWDFATLFRWHIERLNLYPKKLSGVLYVSQSTLSRWINGHTLPKDINYTKRLFTEFYKEEGELYFKELENAYYRDINNSEQEYIDKDEEISVRNLQSNVIFTPIDENNTFISCAIDISSIHNELAPLEHLISPVLKNLGYAYSNAYDFDDLIYYLTNDIQDASDELHRSILSIIDKKFAIIYRGSIKSADTKQLNRLPNLIKGMAALSPKQFRVGLFRLGTSMIVISVISGASFYSALEFAKYMHKFAISTIDMLTHTNHEKMK